ncbi:Sperm-tail PG-rich repeat family protein [Leishmania donovani]|uniref:Sperm-tail PG-rich repeat family protein n=1 Tax=Leishmania donovani TaxID=5661 RepID=A0A504XA67_LEIDO|nr:Sperm-tail PG-rich repeat family protein [Leishmania donovani]
MPSSPSYAAYLREVAREVNATIAPGTLTACLTTSTAAVVAARTTVMVPTSRLSRSRRQRACYAGHDHTSGSANTSRSSAPHTTDLYGGSYAYDYVQVPAMGTLSSAGAVQLYRCWRRRQQKQQRRVDAHMPRSSRSARTAAVHPSSFSHTTSHLTTGTAKQDRERDVDVDVMQRSFQRLYAAMQDEGRRQGHDTVTTERVAHASHSVPCSPQRRSRSCPTRSQRRHMHTASPQALDGAAAAIRVPPMDFDSDSIIVIDDGDNRHRSGTKSVKAEKKSVKTQESPRPTAGSTAASVKVVSPALTSTDTSAITSSPSKPSTSSSRSCSPPRQPRAQRHQCPNCCRRCDSCDCIVLPCPVNAREHRSRGAVADAAHGRCHAHSSPARGRWLSSADCAATNKDGAPAASKTATVDSPRLQWPGQLPATPSRRPSPQQLSSPEVRCHSTRRARHRRRRQSPAHDKHHCRHDRRVDRSCGAHRREKSTSAGAVAAVSSTHGRVDHGKGEAVLRDIATRTCTCYWAEFSGFTMAVNPASHVADCPYQAHDALYAEVMLESKADDGGSGSASTSSHGRCSSSAFLRGRCNTRGKQSSSRHYRQEYDAGAAQLRQALDDPEARRTRGRAAVMGSTKRRTYIEIIMDAARDAPPSQPPRSGSRRSNAKATATSLAAKHDAEVTAAAAPRPPTPTAQASLPSGEAPTKVEDEPQQQLPSNRSSSENDAAAAASDEDKDGAPAAEDQHDEAGRSSRGKKQPLPNDESPLRALSRPRRRPAVGVPGPGSYHVDLAYAASSAAHGIRGAAIPKSARMPAVKSVTPGPGAYDVYKREERKAVAAGGAAAATTDGDATDGKDADTTPTAGKQVIGKGVVFASTSARQLQLRYGDAYVHTSTWAKRAAAVPGPGAYNIVDGDRYDQSRPLGAARTGHQFSKSADGAHFSVVVAAAAAAAAATPLRASLVVPWRDWAGGAYIGTTTSDFVAHPSLAGGNRRTIGQTVAADSYTVCCSNTSAAVAAAAAATDGSLWRGVGSGVALRLTSQRFPMKTAGAPAAAVAGGHDSKTGRTGNAEGAAPPPGEPSPAAYDVERGLRWVQRRAPELSMTFRHDRGPRGPLLSAAAAADDDTLASAVGSSAPRMALPPLSPLLSDDVSFSPGPGTYDVRGVDVWRMRRSPQWSFGTAARHAPSAAVSVSAVAEGTNDLNGRALHAVDHPGPGAYDTEAGYRALQRSAASALICTAPRLTVDGSHRAGVQISAATAGDTVDGARAGPGTYDVESGYKVVRESIKGGVIPRAGADARAKVEGEEVQDGGPGPGAYTLPALPPSGPTAYLGMSAPRFPNEQALAATEGNTTPGPGDYDVDAATSLVNRPGAIIGRAPRVSLLVPTGATSANVGPGSYMLPALPAGRGAVMSTARAVATAETGEAAERPGPGLYDPVDMRASSTRTFSLARTGARFPCSDARVTDAPGPCAYDLPAVPMTRGVVFDTAPRFSRSSGGQSTDGVGPGAYEVVDLSPPVRSAVMGSAVARPDLERKDGNGGGPGAYSPQYAQVEKNAPRVVLARAPAGRGAADYYASGDASMPSHEQRAGAGSELGPGQYDPQYPSDVVQAGRGYTFGSAPRAAAVAGAVDGPGPGAYEVRMTRDGRLVDGGDGSGAAGFGTAPRLAEAGASATMPAGPGPGAYMPEAYTDMSAGFGCGALSPAVRIGSAPRIVGDDARAAADVPGPGAYEPNPCVLYPTVPSISFPRADSAHALGDTDTPGPGAYVTTGFAAARAAQFGCAPRFSEGSVGGLAAYARNGAEGAASVPGPNAYSPNDAAIRPARSAHRFGTAARLANTVGEAAEADGVGPGAYDVEAGLAHSSQGPAAAAYSFPRAGGSGDYIGNPSVGGTAAGGVAESPGPGAYSVEAAYRATLPRVATAILSGGEASGVNGVRGNDKGEASSPGPGAYHLPPFFPEGPQWGFGTSMRSAAADATDGSSALATASPGPGEYAVPAPAPLHSGSSFPKAETASPTGDATLPGPGTYNVVDAAVRPSAPGVRFGTAARYACADVSVGDVDTAAVGVHDGGVPWTPGPGAYSPNVNASSTSRSTRAGPTFSQAPRMALSASADAVEWGAGAQGDNIGPGTYDLHGDMAASTAAAHRFGTAPRMPPATAPGAATKGDVGPGSYMIEAADAQVLPRAPTHTMAPPAPHAPRPQEPRPGPGSYEYPVAVQEHRRSALVLGRHGDSMDITRDTPGPGAYDTDTAYTSTQVARQPGGFTMQGRPAASMPVGLAGGPGPGSYSAGASAASAAAAHRFGTAPRMLSAANGNAGVGPGAYDLPAPPAIRQPVSFTQAPREMVVGSHEGNTDDLHSGDMRGGLVGGGTPGPGSYDVGSAIDCTHMGGRGPSFTIPRGPRPVLRSGDVDASPLVGPGTYSPVDPTSHHHGGGGGSSTNGPSAAFGLAERAVNNIQSGSDAPGPGTYDPHRPSLASGAGIGPSFGSAVRMDDVGGAALAATPGPGTYAVAPSFKATSATGSAPAQRFGTAKRPSAVLNENPGPGSYAVAGYDAATCGAATAPSFGHAEPRPHLACCGLDTPGPGAYYRASNLDGTSTAAGPSFGFGERMRAVAGTATPGPGTYYRDSAASVAAGVVEGRGASFGFGERTSPVLNNYPGPGTYFRGAGLAADVAALRGPLFGTGERHDPKLNSNPGPGTYFRDTLPAAASAAQPRPRRPTAADTLRKLASVGYPTLASKTKPATTTTATDSRSTG